MPHLRKLWLLQVMLLYVVGSWEEPLLGTTIVFKFHWSEEAVEVPIKRQISWLQH